MDLEGRLILTLKRPDLQTFLILSAVQGKTGLGTVMKRPLCPERPPALASYLRAHVENGRLADVTSDGKAVVLTFVAGGKPWRVILETGGRNPGLYAADFEGRLKAALRWEDPGGVFRPNAVYTQAQTPTEEEGGEDGLTLLAAEGARICPPEEDHGPSEGMGVAGLRAEKKLLRRIANIKADLENAPDPEELRLMAHALASSPGTVTKGMEKALIPDPEDPARHLTVELDPRLGRGENIERIHRLAKKAVRKRNMAAKRLGEALEELEKGPAPEPATDKREMKRAAKREEKGVKKPFARYRSSDGWAILAGRNRVENDLLVKEGRPWDLWLHARGGTGAHVLVVKPGKEAKVPDRTLVEAAGLAAFFSSLSGNASVEVSYVELARVRKPKGAGHGKVVFSGERAIRVAPGAGSPGKIS